MELKRFFQQQENGKFHPSWILVFVALTVIIAGIVWMPAWIVPYLDGKPDHMPYLTPASAKVIMVKNEVPVVSVTNMMRRNESRQTVALYLIA